MIVRIAKEFTFDAAHHLPTVPVDHKCHRMHGHTYKATLVLRGRIAENGFLGGIDYADLAEIWNTCIHDVLDHRIMNDTIDVPSTENLVVWIIAELLKNEALALVLDAVRVRESSSTWCEGTVFEFRAENPEARTHRRTRPALPVVK